LIYVYDASYLLTLIIPDEKNPKTDKLHKVVDENDEISTSHLLWYEIANVFTKLIRRKHFTDEQVSQIYFILSFVNIKTDFETGVKYSEKIRELYSKYNLSAYNAAYLELAYRKKAVLCTLDEDLKNAAIKHGVELIKIPSSRENK